MKYHLIWLAVALVLCASGIWFGYQIQNPEIVRESHTMATCGGGDYPIEAFRRINEEVDDKIRDLVGSKEAPHCYVIITPEISGYRTRIITHYDSPIYDDEITDKLSHWITRRMKEIQQSEYEAQQNAVE